MTLLKNEEPNKPIQNMTNIFDAQMITIASPIWGDIIITKDYFFFASFGLDTPEDKQYVYVKSQCMRTKKKKILRWSEVEEVVCRKFLNVDVGVDIYTKYKKCKSFNLITE